MDQTTEANILVVDDDPAIRLVLREFLELRGYAVVEAINGADALDKLDQQSVNLIISDVNMPQKDGIGLLNEVRTRMSIPVLIVTGKPAVGAAVECMKLGAVDYITKPFDLDKVRTTVEKALAEARKNPFVRVPPGQIRQVGHFIVDSVIAEGSMGVILLAAKEDAPEQKVAIKLLLKRASKGMNQTQLLARFRREAEAARAVVHPNIIRIEEFGTTRHDNIPYIAMEYFAGRSLKQLIVDETPLSLTEKLAIIHQLADALGALHQRGICHRDVKPANILVNDAGLAKLTDFGIAKIPDSDLTVTADIFGSPAYLSPEACDTAQVDWRSDIFALGVVAYEFLLLQHPFSGETINQIMNRIQTDRPVAPRKLDPDLPANVEALLGRMLRKKPEERFDDPRDLLRVLDRLALDGAGLGVAQRVRKILRRDWQ